jgi:type II secretory pathway component GspD/PulD (secretin)
MAGILLQLPRVRTYFFWFLWLGVFGGAWAETTHLRVGANETIRVVGLKRVAIARSAIARVRAVPPDQVLITAVKPGRTMVRAWTKMGAELVYPIVVEPEEGAWLSTQVIHVSLEFLELSAQHRGQLGIHWPDAIQFSLGGSAQGGANLSGLNFVGSFSTARGLISLLLKEGWARVLAHPELYVRLGELASFHSGGEIPISTTSEDYGRFHRNVEWKPYGLSVKVRPHSSDGRAIRSDIQIEVSEAGPAVSADQLPSLSKRALDTKMESADGETVLLSGLLREFQAHEKSKTPGLSGLPIVGGLFFQDKNEQREKNEVLMAMTLSFVTSRSREESAKHFEARRDALADGENTP